VIGAYACERDATLARGSRKERVTGSTPAASSEILSGFATMAVRMRQTLGGKHLGQENPCDVFDLAGLASSSRAVATRSRTARGVDGIDGELDGLDPSILGCAARKISAGM